MCRPSVKRSSSCRRSRPTHVSRHSPRPRWCAHPSTTAPSHCSWKPPLARPDPCTPDRARSPCAPTPGEPPWRAALRAPPTKAELAPVVVERLATRPPDDGVETLNELLAPVGAGEAVRHRLNSGEPLAERLGDKVRRCRAAPMETLVELGLIP